MSGTGTEYGIDERIARSYIGRTPSGNTSLLIPLRAGVLPAGRVSGSISIKYFGAGEFALKGEEFTVPAAVVECLNQDLIETFLTMARDLANALCDDVPNAQDVASEVAKWEELFRSRRTLSRDEEVGLWGELWTIMRFTDRGEGVSAWRGPEAHHVDFVANGIGLECKTGLRRLQHFCSQDQLMRPLGDLAVYIQSLWVDIDPIAGQSLPEIIDEVVACLHYPAEFEKKLLTTGYSRADAGSYKSKLRVLERPLLFRIEDVPRVREFDSGVSQIRFMATLDPSVALAPADAMSVVLSVCS